MSVSAVASDATGPLFRARSDQTRSIPSNYDEVRAAVSSNVLPSPTEDLEPAPRGDASFEDVPAEELVSRARSGDRDAYSALFHRFHDEVYRFATRRLGDAQLGQDVAAETFADAFAGLPRFRWTGAPFEAWLYTIARRRVADALRKRSAAASAAPEHAFPQTDRSTAIVDGLYVRALLEHLSDAERDVIELRFMEDLDVEQTAVRLGKTPGAVRVAQHRALHRLRELSGGAL